MGQFDGKRVLVLGLAREGVSLARFLRREGATVTATDNADRSALPAQLSSLDESQVRIVLGGVHPELVSEADAVFVSPGVPETNAVYIEASRRGTPVGSMTTLFFDLCPGSIVGITGSSGKTTTTGLIGHMSREAGMDVVVGGNIGEPMIDLLPAVGPDNEHFAQPPGSSRHDGRVRQGQATHRRSPVSQ
jgi:UDP-N-acetylmuramoylalanine--D-glutamate ligase